MFETCCLVFFDAIRLGSFVVLTLLAVQFHGHLSGAEPGADGEGAHLPDGERPHLDGWSEQPQHTLCRGELGQGCAWRAVKWTWLIH